MNAEQIDLFIEEIKDGLYLRICGTFGFTQLASLREKVTGLLNKPGKIFFLDIDKARFCDEEYQSLFLFWKRRSKMGRNWFLFFLAKRTKLFSAVTPIYLR